MFQGPKGYIAQVCVTQKRLVVRDDCMELTLSVSLYS